MKKLLQNANLTIDDLIPEMQRIHIESQNPLKKVFRGK